MAKLVGEQKQKIFFELLRLSTRFTRRFANKCIFYAVHKCVAGRGIEGHRENIRENSENYFFAPLDRV